MNLLKVIQRFAYAVYAADATILTLLVHENVISNQTSLDIAAIITALAVGFHGSQAIGAINANKSTADGTTANSTLTTTGDSNAPGESDQRAPGLPAES